MDHVDGCTCCPIHERHYSFVNAAPVVKLWPKIILLPKGVLIDFFWLLIVACTPDYPTVRSVCIIQFTCIKLNDYSWPMSLKLCYSQMDRGWMYLETVTTPFMEGIDSFVKATKAYARNNVASSKGCIHCRCVDCKNEKAFRIDNVE